MKTRRYALLIVGIALLIGLAFCFAGCGSSTGGSGGEDADVQTEAGADSDAGEANTDSEAGEASGNGNAGGEGEGIGSPGSESFAAGKIHDDKPWVYDADYSIPTDVDSYYGYPDHSRLVQVSDIVVPYINLNSLDAGDANREIYGIYANLIKEFNENAKEEIGICVSDYDAFVLDNAISVLITETAEGTDVPWYDYHTYVFAKDNGTRQNYREICALAGTTVEKAGEAVKKNIREDTLKDFADLPDIDKYIDQSIDEFETAEKDGEVNAYLDKKGRVNVVVKKYFPAGGGVANAIIPAY